MIILGYLFSENEKIYLTRYAKVNLRMCVDKFDQSIFN